MTVRQRGHQIEDLLEIDSGILEAVVVIALVLAVQPLRERTVQPVGSSKLVAVDVRVLSATPQDLDEAILERRFRADLFYRIKGIELVVPPLR